MSRRLHSAKFASRYGARCSELCLQGFVQFTNHVGGNTFQSRQSMNNLHAVFFWKFPDNLTCHWRFQVRYNDGRRLRMFANYKRRNRFWLKHAHSFQSDGNSFTRCRNVVENFGCLGRVQSFHQCTLKEVHSGNSKAARTTFHGIIEFFIDGVYVTLINITERGHIVTHRLDLSFIQVCHYFGGTFFTHGHQ